VKAFGINAHSKGESAPDLCVIPNKAISALLDARDRTGGRFVVELILIVILVIILFGGGFGYYRGGYHTRGGPYGVGGILGVILIVILIVWLLRGGGYVGGF